MIGTHIIAYLARASHDDRCFSNLSEVVESVMRASLSVTPAHGWLWLCARLVGGKIECGPVVSPSDPIE